MDTISYDECKSYEGRTAIVKNPKCGAQYGVQIVAKFEYFAGRYTFRVLGQPSNNGIGQNVGLGEVIVTDDPVVLKAANDAAIQWFIDQENEVGVSVWTTRAIAEYRAYGETIR